MARKNYGEDDILRLIREVEVHCNSGLDVMNACNTTGISDKNYYGWRTQYERFGDRMIGEFLRAEGWHINRKNVERSWREKGLALPAHHKNASNDTPKTDQ
ncbi:hypothetical protein N9747_06765 [Planktomarina sp.]|nr:hypothetical protein [Planktomarina sp.]